MADLTAQPVNTFADAFGRWHVQVPADAENPDVLASTALITELVEREHKVGETREAATQRITRYVSENMVLRHEQPNPEWIEYLEYRLAIERASERTYEGPVR